MSDYLKHEGVFVSARRLKHLKPQQPEDPLGALVEIEEETGQA